MGKAQTDRQTAYISILIMHHLLSKGLLIIAVHSALLFRNHYEARKRSLTSFYLADLLVLTMRGGGRQGGGVLCSAEEIEEGRSKMKERGEVERMNSLAKYSLD